MIINMTRRGRDLFNLIMLRLVSHILGSTKSVCDQIPWQVVALTAAWLLRGGFQSVGTKSLEEFEARYEMQVLRDPLWSRSG